MKIKQFTIQKTFAIKYKGNDYYVDYLNSNDQILGLINRDNWTIFNENQEQIIINKKTEKLLRKLVKFCIKHFEDYNPLKEGEELEAEVKKGEIKLKRK